MPLVRLRKLEALTTEQVLGDIDQPKRAISSVLRSVARGIVCCEHVLGFEHTTTSDGLNLHLSSVIFALHGHILLKAIC